MPELENIKEKLVNFRISDEFLIQIDEYWKKTGKFTNRTEFVLHLLREELASETYAKNITERLDQLQKEVDRLLEKNL